MLNFVFEGNLINFILLYIFFLLRKGFSLFNHIGYGQVKNATDKLGTIHRQQ